MFLPTLQETRNEHILAANAECKNAVEAILAKVIIPVEKMRETLLEAAKKGTYARANFIVDLHSLLLRSVPLCAHVLAIYDEGFLQRVELDKCTIRSNHQLVERLFMHKEFFPGIGRIKKELVAAFPDAHISMSVKTCFDVNSSLLLEFVVSYTLKNPEGLLQV